jgi:3-hydroxyacyl-CoA dehydrogenase
MKLLEVVAGPDTDPALVQALADFGDKVLGKGIVYGKDTVNFVANRIGTYGMMRILHQVKDFGLNVSQVDTIFGKPMGRPKSAIFRTADLVGLDTLVHVAENCYENLPDDPAREAFQVPDFIRAMLDKGLLGTKSGQGFYKKTRGPDGKTKISALNLETLEYEDQGRPRFDSLGAIRNIEDGAERVKALLAHGDVASNFAWTATADTLLYAASLIGEIADDIVNIDRALRWGFGWDQGPFESWDAIGLAESVERMKADGREIPAVVETAVAAGGWYSRSNGETRYLDVVGSLERKIVPELTGAISLRDLKEKGKVVQENLGASLVDLGDDILCLEFHTKMNALDDDIIGMYNRGLDLLDEGPWAGLVVGNEGEHFSAGANIMLILMTAMAKDWSKLTDITKALQDTLMRAKYSSKPVVTAVHGLALGGGCEVTMHSAATRAAGETYIGLVEVGVGLLPAGGGCKETVWRLVESIPHGAAVETFPLIQKAFEQIGMGKIAESAGLAKQFGYLRPSDKISMNRDRLLADAKQTALGLARANYRAPARRKVALPGRDGKAALAAGIWGFINSGFISEHDAKIGNKIAHVLCGGDVAPGTLTDEQTLLDLEREAFVSLCGEPKTIERIQHMLMKGKPLRN